MMISFFADKINHDDKCIDRTPMASRTTFIPFSRRINTSSVALLVRSMPSVYKKVIDPLKTQIMQIRAKEKTHIV